jgi:hypothetical protein
MRYLIFFFMLISWKFSSGQQFDFPSLPIYGTTIANVTPSHWTVINTTYGDLNGDKKQDLVLILEYDYPVAELRAYGNPDTEIIKEVQKPRMLAIYFRQSENRFVFALQNNNFILRDKEGAAAEDPFDGITIANNTLNLRFKGGSSWRWKLDYQFKYEQQHWTLINAKNLYYNSGSGEMEEKNYNFLTRKVKATTGNLNNDALAKVSFYDLSVNKLRTFDTFKKPWTWEITKDNYL